MQPEKQQLAPRTRDVFTTYLDSKNALIRDGIFTEAELIRVGNFSGASLQFILDHKDSIYKLNNSEIALSALQEEEILKEPGIVYRITDQPDNFIKFLQIQPISILIAHMQYNYRVACQVLRNINAIMHFMQYHFTYEEILQKNEQDHHFLNIIGAYYSSIDKFRVLGMDSHAMLDFYHKAKRITKKSVNSYTILSFFQYANESIGWMQGKLCSDTYPMTDLTLIFYSGDTNNQILTHQKSIVYGIQNEFFTFIDFLNMSYQNNHVMWNMLQNINSLQQYLNLGLKFQDFYKLGCADINILQKYLYHPEEKIAELEKKIEETKSTTVRSVIINSQDGKTLMHVIVFLNMSSKCVKLITFKIAEKNIVQDTNSNSVCNL